MIGDANQHLPKFFCQSFAAVFSPNFFTAKVFYNTVRKALLESELDLLKYCNIDILTLILMRNKLKLSSHCCAHLALQK